MLLKRAKPSDSVTSRTHTFSHSHIAHSHTPDTHTSHVSMPALHTHRHTHTLTLKSQSFARSLTHSHSDAHTLTTTGPSSSQGPTAARAGLGCSPLLGSAAHPGQEGWFPATDDQGVSRGHHVAPPGRARVRRGGARRAGRAEWVRPVEMGPGSARVPRPLPQASPPPRQWVPVPRDALRPRRPLPAYRAQLGPHGGPALRSLCSRRRDRRAPARVTSEQGRGRGARRARGAGAGAGTGSLRPLLPRTGDGEVGMRPSALEALPPLCGPTRDGGLSGPRSPP